MEQQPRDNRLRRFAEQRLQAEMTAYHRMLDTFRARIFGGLALLLPVAITFWIIMWLYSTLRDYVLNPMIGLVQWVYGGVPPEVDRTGLGRYFVPVIAVFFAFLILYALGMLVRSRLHRALDWLLLHVPIVTTIYGSVRSVFNSLDQQASFTRFSRIVLVAFPHPGVRTPGFVTATSRDEATGKTILSVYVTTSPLPTSGYLLLVPEDEVTDLNWNLDQTLQALVSWGMNSPKTIANFSAEKPQE